MSIPAHIELPYDRGHQWHLVVGDERAVISEVAAVVLIGRFKVAVNGVRQEHAESAAETIGENYWLSKKARKLLETAGVEIK